MYNPFFTGSTVTILMLLLVIWTIIWKVYAVWTAVKNDHKKWFVAILILNTVGILEIFYIFKIANKSWVEVKTDFGYALSKVGGAKKKEDEVPKNQ